MRTKKNSCDRKKDNSGVIRQVIRLVVTVVLLVAVSAGVFTLFYHRYNDRILYAERLSQMQDVTAQLFTGLEDVVAMQWNTADVLLNYMEEGQPGSAEELQLFMEQQAKLNNLNPERDNLIAVDNSGRYYTIEGIKGTLQELDYLLDEPDRISYVSNTVTTNRTKMVFLEALAEPVALEDGSELIYYGLARDMSELEPYFDCAAYEGDSGVYVIDEAGLKLFSSTNGSAIEGIQGYNVYHVLENMQYLHGTSFEAAQSELEQNGRTYSNAVLNGEEYFYSMYHMQNAEWTLVFLVRSSAVAMNTVKLVNTTMWIVMAFVGCMAIICAGYILRTQRKQQKKELAVAEANSAELEKLNQDLEAASRAKSEFLANMSHDIRTPMNAIVGITELMEHEAGSSDRLHTYIQKVQLSSRHLLSLVNDVLDMSKIESSEVALNQDSICLAEQIGQVDSIIRPQTAERGQEFHIRVHTITHEYLIGDSVRLRQILLNLLSNAVKYTQYGGTVNFELTELPCDRSGYATFGIAVEDNGCGMTPEFLEHIFEPFTRAENSVTNKVQGTGLGMAITKNIVNLMGGTIHVWSEQNKGSRFEVVLTFPVDSTGEHTLESQGILLLSEDEILRGNVEASLKETSIPLWMAENPAEAVWMAGEHPVDIVLIDGCRQENDRMAVQALQAGRREPLLIFLCDYASPESLAERVKNSGASGWIARPFFFSDLIRVVEQVKESPASKERKGSALKGMRFLCAEDNELNAEILEAILDMNGASCVIYPDGAKLVQAFGNVDPGEYDAILMDIQMPNMNGLEATAAIRSGSNPLGQSIPIIAMTANAFAEDVQKCLQAGMDAHVSKPLDTVVLERTLRSLLAGRKG